MSFRWTVDQWRTYQRQHGVPPTESPVVSEKVFQAAVVRLAKQQGWAVYHTHDSRRSPSGFPDLVCVRKEVCLAWELKSAEGVLTLQQAAWLRLLGQVTRVEAGVYRPEQWEAIVETLRGAVSP